MRNADVLSLSARRAWIEIDVDDLADLRIGGRSPQGERGLKFCRSILSRDLAPGRSPQGERGLKYRDCRYQQATAHVALRKESVD